MSSDHLFQNPLSARKQVPEITTQATKSLAIPAPGKRPGFDQVAAIALMGAITCSQSVCVLCLTQELLERWLRRLEELPAPVTLLDVTGNNRATLKDWQELLGHHACDVTILHGACDELRVNRLSVGYVRALVEAVPSGLVVIA
ncbi:MAG: hypothetical protein Kow0063_26280 [Anaerolineae bacterium]